MGNGLKVVTSKNCMVIVNMNLREGVNWGIGGREVLVLWGIKHCNLSYPWLKILGFSF